MSEETSARAAMVVDLRDDAKARIPEDSVAGVGVVENPHRPTAKAKTDTQTPKSRSF